MFDLFSKFRPEMTHEEYLLLKGGARSRLFFSTVPENEYKKFFLDYFTEIELEEFKIDFLKTPQWTRAYTTNFDNAIESTGIFQAVIPYQNYKHIVDISRPIYKVHGDAYSEAVYTDCEGVAFRNSWVNNLTERKNEFFVKQLLYDFCCNSIIYIGSRGPGGRVQRIFNKGSPDRSMRHMIVLDRIPSQKEEEALWLFGISIVILVEKYKDFYTEFLQAVSAEIF